MISVALGAFALLLSTVLRDRNAHHLAVLLVTSAAAAGSFAFAAWLSPQAILGANGIWLLKMIAGRKSA